MSSKRSNTSAEVRSLRAKLRQRDATIKALREEIADMKKDMTFLRNEVDRLLRERGGPPTIPEGQLTLFGPPDVDEGADTEASSPEVGDEDEDGKSPGGGSGKGCGASSRSQRKLDIAALPREKITHELSPEERRCSETGVELVPIGTKIFEELDYVPAQLRVIEHHRTQYGPAPEVAEERQIAPIVAPMPDRPIDDSMASAGLLAQVMLQKYSQHLPLYRQEDVFQQAGLKIPRQTLCDWVLRAAFELRPIADELMRQIRAGPVMALDDTPVKCQGPKGSSHFQACLWTFVNPEVDGVAYRFTPGRGSEHIEKFLDGCLQYLVGDGYSGHFAAAKAVGGGIVHGGCWAHVFRKFRDAMSEGRWLAKRLMTLIRKLFDIEAAADRDDLDSQQRLDLRRAKGRTLLAQILWQTRGWKDDFSTSGKMGEAMKYLTNQWKRLRCFLLDGRVPIHNNACENSIRPIAVGRRNWLFVGSERGGEAAAIIYTLLESCRLANVDRWVYLRDVLTRVATHPARQIADLVPARWAALRGENAVREVHAVVLD